MRFEEYPPKAVEIRARYGLCRLCGKELAGLEAIFLPDIRSVICGEHRGGYLVVEEYDSGYQRDYTVVDVVGSFEEARQKSNELNMNRLRARVGTGFSYRSYTYMPVSQALNMRVRNVEIEED